MRFIVGRGAVRDKPQPARMRRCRSAPYLSRCPQKSNRSGRAQAKRRAHEAAGRITGPGRGMRAECNAGEASRCPRRSRGFGAGRSQGAGGGQNPGFGAPPPGRACPVAPVSPLRLGQNHGFGAFNQVVIALSRSSVLAVVKNRGLVHTEILRTGKTSSCTLPEAQ